MQTKRNLGMPGRSVADAAAAEFALPGVRRCVAGTTFRANVFRADRTAVVTKTNV